MKLINFCNQNRMRTIRPIKAMEASTWMKMKKIFTNTWEMIRKRMKKMMLIVIIVAVRINNRIIRILKEMFMKKGNLVRNSKLSNNHKNV